MFVWITLGRQKWWYLGKKKCIFEIEKLKGIYVKTKNTWYWRPWCVIRGWNIFFGRGTFISVSEKKEEKNTLWINKFRTFLFVFDSHIGIILILYVCRTMQIAKIFVEMFQKLCNNIIWISIKDLHLTNSNKTNTQKNL